MNASVLVFPHHCQHQQSVPGILCQLIRPWSISQLRSALLTRMAAPLQIARNREDYFELLIRLLRPTVAARRRLLTLRGKVGLPTLSLGVGFSIRLISNLEIPRYAVKATLPRRNSGVFCGCLVLSPAAGASGGRGTAAVAALQAVVPGARDGAHCHGALGLVP